MATGLAMDPNRLLADTDPRRRRVDMAQHRKQAATVLLRQRVDMEHRLPRPVDMELRQFPRQADMGLP
jgi:hypothetical protein